MPRILFIEHNGTEHSCDGDVGRSLMQTAVENRIPGIIGDCSGCCTCATCHGYIEEGWIGKLPPRSEDEAMMLEGALSIQDNSRLTCQITITQELDGLVVRLPEHQY